MHGTKVAPLTKVQCPALEHDRVWRSARAVRSQPATDCDIVRRSRIQFGISIVTMMDAVYDEILSCCTLILITHRHRPALHFNIPESSQIRVDCDWSVEGSKLVLKSWEWNVSVSVPRSTLVKNSTEHSTRTGGPWKFRLSAESTQEMAPFDRLPKQSQALSKASKSFLSCRAVTSVFLRLFKLTDSVKAKEQDPSYLADNVMVLR